MEKPNLRLIKSPPPLGPINHFWASCPRKLKEMPTEHCPKGRPKLTGADDRVVEEPECKWWINSPKHNYCFWRYIQDKSNPDGVMPELPQSELARLFGWSNTKMHLAVKDAMVELKDKLETHGADQLAEESETEEYSEMVGLEQTEVPEFE